MKGIARRALATRSALRWVNKIGGGSLRIGIADARCSGASTRDDGEVPARFS